ncbi:hypothetical protein M569_03024 [Genlisea aurea]|uniref:Heptahelical transmembrane protein 1 n=1 Tax=Genlisea aurea TaxID=192259 RepID=S8EGD5_9LAMI|nr:hypothetical protein M569_03024 [Genlisea aurea]
MCRNYIGNGAVSRRRKAMAVAADEIQKEEEEEPISCGKKKKKKKKSEYALKSFEELPEYMKDNEFILRYYRVDWPFKESLLSLFRWHNETLNVWTHLIGFLVFVGLTVVNSIDAPPQLADFITIFTGHLESNMNSSRKRDFVSEHLKLADINHQSSPPATNWPFYVFLSGAMFCLLTSSTCHLFFCHSKKLSLHLLQLDYVGITVMIITSFFPPIFYIFLCSPHWQLLYLLGITLIGICTVLTLLTPSFSAGKYRSFRALLFVSMGLFGLVPAVHALVANWDDPHRDVTLAYESAMAGFYLTGAAVYVGRIPERWRPGWFDIAGHSHQIFHVFVVMGALAHYGATQVFLRFRSRMVCVAS